MRTPSRKADLALTAPLAVVEGGANVGNGNGKPARKTTSAVGKGFTPSSSSTARWGKRGLSITKALDCFDRCVEVLSATQRNSLRRKARLLRARAALGLKQEISPQEIAQRVLEAKDRQAGHLFEALTAADRAAMPRPVVRWHIPQLLPQGDFTIIGGRPKVGKSRLAVDIARAILNASDCLGFGAPAEPQTVILVTDDQADGDSADMLDALGLWHHPRLIWSRHFRLNELNLDGLLTAIHANPGAVVILDSLRSISRNLQHGENDPEIGATLYDLKAAVLDAGGTLVVIHHCNKADGLIGTEALSGHGAIAGAANTVLTLHYVTSDGRPVKDAPQRRLVREARSGVGFDLVISRSPDGKGFHRVGPYADWQQQADQEHKVERLTSEQQQALEVLESAPDRLWTVRDVLEELGMVWVDSQSRTAQQYRRALGRLQELEKAKGGKVKNGLAWQINPLVHTLDKPEILDKPVAVQGIWGCSGK